MKKKYEVPQTQAVRMESMPLLIGGSLTVDDEKIGTVYPNDPSAGNPPAEDDGGWDEDDWGNNW